MDLRLDTPVQYIPRVGPVMAKKLDKLGIRTVEDLLWYTPFRYDDLSVISPIAKIRVGAAVTVTGTIHSIANFRTKTGKKMQQAIITDDTGTIPTVWFNQPFLLNSLKKGTHVCLAGNVGWFGHSKVLESPIYELGTEPKMSLHMGRLVPIYSETDGLSSKWLRGRINVLLENCIEQVFEYIPDSIRSKYGLIEIQKAIEYIHFPITKTSAEQARRRLAFDELFLTQLFANEQKRLWQTTQNAHPIHLERILLSRVIQTLSFTLTGDQQKAIREILDDMAKSIPMNRLLEGDVGSGKTVVAAIAMYAVFRNGMKSLFMAPTQILAEQHFDTISKFLTPLGLTIVLVTGEKKFNPKKSFDVLIGTHAIMNLTISNMGLVIIDEQQRFGVRQRGDLTKTKGKTPHLLTMTATPIPRTVARAMYGNLDLSIVETMPSGRQKVKTWIVPKEKRGSAYQWIAKTILETKGQAFIICPLIEDSETLSTVKAVKTEFVRLQKIFKNFRLGLVHGRLKPQEKTDILSHFHKGNLDILVATPVVEVGIDVPNATIMMIEGGERFGLAQLHQLRGRVGRGMLQSYCLIFTQSQDPKTTERLKVLETIYSGPKLAEVDLKLRGPGEIFGTRQHGLPMFKVASYGDVRGIAEAQEAATIVTGISPDLSQFPQLREKLKKGIITPQD